MNLAPWLRDAALTLGLCAAILIVILLDRPKDGQPLAPAKDDQPFALSKDGESAGNWDRREDAAKQEGTARREDGAKQEAPHLFAASSIYAKRVVANRGEWLEKVGGTPQTEEAVHAGLNWLVRHQAQDGSWSPSCLGRGALSRCEQDNNPCTAPGGEYPYAQTGLAVLALQAGGNFDFLQSRFSSHVHNGLQWMVEHQREDGALFLRESGQQMYEHGIALFALAEALALEKAAARPPDPARLRAVEKALEFLLKQEHDDGGFRYNGDQRAASDTSVSGWQMLALKTCIEAGIEVPRDRLDRLTEFFQRCEMHDRGRTAYMSSGMQNTEATTGVGMMVHQFLLKTPKSPLVTAAAPYLVEYIERNPTWNGNDYYLLYNCTLPMFQVGDAPWKRWNSIVREMLLDKQLHAGCERGSWPPISEHDVPGGRVYTTALATLTLEVYYRFAKPTEK